MNERKQPSLFDAATETVLLLPIVVVIVMVPLLLCEWVARLAFPIPVAATPEMQRSLTEQRESMSKLLFAFIWAILIGWAVISS
ncbi:MAG: hypothetical protein ABMA26_16975 [Limisphaerales bacterium]